MYEPPCWSELSCCAACGQCWLKLHSHREYHKRHDAPVDCHVPHHRHIARRDSFVREPELKDHRLSGDLDHALHFRERRIEWNHKRECKSSERIRKAGSPLMLESA